MDNENETNHNMIQKILDLKNVLEQQKKSTTGSWKIIYMSYLITLKIKTKNNS